MLCTYKATPKQSAGKVASIMIELNGLIFMTKKKPNFLSEALIQVTVTKTQHI